MDISLLPLVREERMSSKQMEKAVEVRRSSASITSREFEAQSIEEPKKIVEKKEKEKKAEPSVTISEEKKISDDEKVEALLSKEEQKPVISPLVQDEVRVVSISEPIASLLGSEKKEIEGKQEERVVVAALGNTVPQSSSSEKSDVAAKSPSLSESEIILAQPRYADNPKPLYPQEAKKKGYEGEVLLRVEILSNGRVGEIGVKRSSGYGVLDRSAMTAVKQWRFIPARKGETPVPVWVNIPVVFQLR
jgi:TonB family protein